MTDTGYLYEYFLTHSEESSSVQLTEEEADQETSDGKQ